MSGAENYVDPLERHPKFKQLMTSRQPQLTPNANISRMALTARQQLDWNTIQRPCIYKVSASTIDSTSTGDTVLLTGVENKTLLINNISCYQSNTGSGTFRIEMDYGSSFGSTARISKTNTDDKETQGQQLILKSTERIVLNVTTSASSSSIDAVISYQELGFGSVYG